MWVKSLTISNVLLIHLIVAGDVGDHCVPNENTPEGTCVVITDCEVAVRSIKNKDYHQFRRCGFSGLLEIVCCPRTTDKFGVSTDPPLSSLRIADRECRKIIDSRIPPLDLHIIGGEAASLGEFPHMVALGFDRGNGYQFDCGGSLLSNTYILTAAHCVDTLDGIKPSIVRMGVVELGDNQWNKETDIRISQIIQHPTYSRREKYHDLAILKLERPAQFSSTLSPVCLYTNMDNPSVPLTITGWGTTSTTRDTRSSVLLKANVTIVSRAACDESYTSWRKLPQGISDQQLCAGDSDGLRDTCQGDSGGPLQGFTSSDGHFRLIGVTSFGRGCGSPVPGVYTRVARYLDWIESVVWPN